MGNEGRQNCRVVINHDFGLFWKQAAFIESDADELGYSGGFGGGKTLMVCLKAYLRARHPRAVEVLCRAKFDDVKDTILPTLFEGSGDTPPVLYPGTYAWNKSDRTIRLFGGGLIRYIGLGEKRRNALDNMKFRGQNVTGVGIDQAEEITGKQYINALGRIRSAGQGLTRQLYWSCNPAAPSHHLAVRFGIKPGHKPDETAVIDRVLKNPHPTTGEDLINRLKVILTSPMDIAEVLPPDYLARLATYTGVMRMRYVLGMWVGSEGVIYDNFSRLHNVKAREGPWARRLAFIDDGTSRPAAILLALVDNLGRVHIRREVHRAGMLEAEKIRHVRDMNVELAIVDPAAAALKLALRNAGVAVMDGDNDVLPGIQNVREALNPGADGAADLTFDPSCENTIGEHEGYEWDENAKGEKPVKVNDHGPDAVRYGIRHLRNPPGLVFDTRGLVDVEAATRRQEPPRVGTLTHDLPQGQRQDLSIADRKAALVSFEETREGPLQVWIAPDEDDARNYAVYAAAGDGQGPSVVLVADVNRRTLAAQWVKACPPERLARLVAMLSLWYGKTEGELEPETTPAPIGYIAGRISVPGEVLGQHLGRLEIPAVAWEPNPVEFAEAVGLLRAAWEARHFIERDPAVFATARQYVYSAGTVMHACLVGAAERRGSHADGLMARAGLWRMLASMPPDEIPEREAPVGSAEYRRRQRRAAEERKESVHFY